MDWKLGKYKKILIGLLVCFCQNLFGYDPFNTYQFNRNSQFDIPGRTEEKPWFEWWYYKIVIPEKNKSFFFVYGVVNPWDNGAVAKFPSSRSYVGMGDFSNSLILEEQFKPSEFSAAYNETKVQVGSNLGDVKNIATDKGIEGFISTSNGQKAQWQIEFSKQWAFNATGGATGKNVTNIEWYPAQADARCSGEVIVNGESVKFKDVPCYQDRNWGTSFPEWWGWIVSNHFEGYPGTTLAIGGGKPTVLSSYKQMQGFAIGLKHKGREYSWLPQHAPLVKFHVQFGKWEIETYKPTQRLKIIASAPKEKFLDLQFVTPQGERFHDFETLDGDIEVQIFERKSILDPWTLKDKLISHHAGLEFGSFKDLNSKDLDQMNICLLGCEMGAF